MAQKASSVICSQLVCDVQKNQKGSFHFFLMVNVTTVLVTFLVGEKSNLSKVDAFWTDLIQKKKKSKTKWPCVTIKVFF